MVTLIYVGILLAAFADGQTWLVALASAALIWSLAVRRETRRP